ncbi:MAG: hypothetical protein M3043_02310 [Lysinibacillus fusiformis]|nr:hypothetical protein [Lysinibacillus fusiformis]MCT6929641.1 hypothetical protein [Lysinibacillus fusiformis]MCT6934036.1 hypothetical protein [Lysinibacillus fusiformis]
MGKKTYTQKEAEEFAELYGYELLDYFRGKNKSHLFRCPKKHETRIIFRKIEIGACRECSNERMREQYRTTFKEIEEYFTKLRETYSNIELLTTRKDYEVYNGPANKFYLSYIFYLCIKPKPGRFQDVKMAIFFAKVVVLNKKILIDN